MIKGAEIATADMLMSKTDPTNVQPDFFTHATKITTMTGDIALGALAPGSPVLTSRGILVPQMNFHYALPIKTMLIVARNAFGHDWPAADTPLSPEQPLTLWQRPKHQKRNAKTLTLGALQSTMGTEIQTLQTSERLISLGFSCPTVVFIAGLPVLIGAQGAPTYR